MSEVTGTQWRWADDHWQHQLSSGEWVAGDGPDDANHAADDEFLTGDKWRRSEDGAWQCLGADGWWYDRDPDKDGDYWRESADGSIAQWFTDGDWVTGEEDVDDDLIPDGLDSGQLSSDEKVVIHPTAGWLAIGAGVVLAVGAFLPWVTRIVPFLGTINRNGFQLGQDLGFSADGLIPLLLGLVLVAIGVGVLIADQGPKWLQSAGPGIVIAVGLIGILVAVGEGVTLSGANGYQVAAGIYLMGVAGLVGVIAGIVGMTL